MARTRLPESKIREILAENAAGSGVTDVVKKHKISTATFYNWKSKYGEKGGVTAKRGRPKGAKNLVAPAKTSTAAVSSSTADENRRLKVMIVDLMLQVEQLKESARR